MSWLLYVIGAWFLAFNLFIAMVHARNIAKENGLSVFWKVNIYPALVVFGLLDVGFNLVVGTLMYLETPREWTFTARCKRHVTRDSWRGHVARFWQRQLNVVDPGHV